MRTTVNFYVMISLLAISLATGTLWASDSLEELTIGDYVYEFYRDPSSGERECRIVGLTPGYEPQGEVRIPAVVMVSGEEIKISGIGRIDSDGVESPAVFRDYSGMTSVEIGENIREIGPGEFYGCGSIEYYKVAEKNRFFSSTDGLLLSTSTGYINLLRYPSARSEAGWTVPPYIFKVLEGAFAANDHLTTLFLSGQTRMGSCWQAGNNKIKIVNATQSDIYDRARSMDGDLFERIEGGEHPKYSLVSYCPGSSWYGLTFPSDVVRMEEGAFCNAKVRSLEFGSRLDSIPPRAFEYSAVETVSMPGLSRGIGVKAFYNCTGLKNLKIPGGEESEIEFRIGDEAFYNCCSLDTVSFGGNINKISIGRESFRDCSSLKLFKYGHIPTKFSSVGSMAFKGCKEFHSFPVNFIEKIESGAEDIFAEAGLMTMVWTPNVTEIPQGCFKNCYRLKDVTMQSKARIIRSEAFMGCALEEFDSRNIITIDEAAFYNTPELALIYISDFSDRMVLAGRFGMENQECKLIVDNKQLAATECDNDQSCYYNTTLYISALDSFLPSSEWKEIYVPAGAAQNYLNYVDSPKEMFSLYILESEGKLWVNPNIEELEILAVRIDGKEAEMETDNKWIPSDELKAGTPIGLTVDYSIHGKELSTHYEELILTDISSVVETDEIKNRIEYCGGGIYDWGCIKKWFLFNSEGTVIKSGNGARLDIKDMDYSIYILYVEGMKPVKIIPGVHPSFL